uniref:Uncharacterized protein n=1 Tax=Avena sativa TaxID=4498 RepID=A0ACD5ZKJ9_AVESA
MRFLWGFSLSLTSFVLLILGYHMMFVLYTCLLSLNVVVCHYGLPSHSYVSEVADGGSILGGVETEMLADQENVPRRHFFLVSASEGLPYPYDQAAVQDIHFLRDFCGFLIFVSNYQCMLVYREVAWLVVVPDALLTRSAQPIYACH